MEMHPAPNDILFTYLQKILYDPEQASLDLAALPAEQQKLADGLKLLLHFVIENKELCEDVSNGKISAARMPERANPLVGPLKNVHHTLQHLIWLMDEVAAGDYEQRLQAMGDVSVSFNNMVNYLVELSRHDRLTGLLNSEGFTVQAKAILNRATNYSGYYMIIININDFRHFNAVYDSKRGDDLLIKVAKQLQSCCREGEVCGRLHVDNFVCLAKGENVEDICSRFILERQSKWPYPPNHSLLFRHGIYPITDTTTPIRDMIEYTSYTANSIRHNGTLSYAVFNPELARQYKLENHVMETFSQAMASNAFKTYYQPKVDPTTGKIVSCEALARWQPPHGSLIMPEQFINLFEATGLITALDFHVVNQVCSMLRKRLDAKLPILQVAINFSRVHLHSVDFIPNLLKILKRYQIDPSYIQVEITETALFENIPITLKVVKELKSAGLTIAMDDFGSGYSSLNFLKNIPIDILKIDKLFFDNFAGDKRTKLLLTDVLSLARHLNLKTVAEGVETKEEVDFLAQEKCDFIQGYYFYRPMTEEQFHKVLAEQ
jgi:EAL domain-containing protein (putative c-di-GMP-specific phosphodiesterase class I)/GGDEF domain-containing protein